MTKKVRCLVALFFSATFLTLPLSAEPGYVTGDFHQHTTYSDGSYSFGKMMEMNNAFGLDWWANNDHGGAYNRWGTVSGNDLGSTVLWSNTGIELLGTPNSDPTKMWRWQSLRDWSFRDIQLWRRVFPEKVIVQGYEMNVPGHEHASMSILANQFDETNANVEPLAQFEYMFDNSDQDVSEPNGWVKSTKSGHEKAIEAMTWLQTNYPNQSWVIPAHPERYKYNGNTGWNIEHFRDLNNAAPDVFFGFESIPGHQKGSRRGEYGSNRPSYGTDTYGGAGWMCARVGGLWDALLSEGRAFWLFANSDCHNNEESGSDFFPGEYQKNYTYVAQKNDAQAIADGMRSGNTYCVMGDLIDSLSFNIEQVSMGSVYLTNNDSVTISITVRDPQTENNNRYGEYKNPVLDHIDLIAGIVGTKIEPSDALYTVDSINTTKVIARFGETAGYSDAAGIVTKSWTNLGNGWKKMAFTYAIPAGKKLYFRLRGTNQAVNVEGETDNFGNPLIDEENNTAIKAFSDVWFYSNPVYASSTLTTKTPSNQIESFSIVSNPATATLTVNGLDKIEKMELFTLSGLNVASVKNTTTMNVATQPNGMYLLKVLSGNRQYVEQVQVK